MKSKIRVAVIDDHPLLREGVVSVLTSCHDIEVVAQGSSSDAVAERAESASLMSCCSTSAFRGGLSAIKAIAAYSPETRDDATVGDNDVLEALRLGASLRRKGWAAANSCRCAPPRENDISPSGAMLLSDVDSGKRPRRKRMPSEAQ